VSARVHAAILVILLLAIIVVIVVKHGSGIGRGVRSSGGAGGICAVTGIAIAAVGERVLSQHRGTCETVEKKKLCFHLYHATCREGACSFSARPPPSVVLGLRGPSRPELQFSSPTKKEVGGGGGKGREQRARRAVQARRAVEDAPDRHCAHTTPSGNSKNPCS